MAKIDTPWHDTLRILTAFGFYSSTKSKRPVIILLFYVILATYVVCMILIQFVNVAGDIYLLVMNIEALCAFGQILGKLIIIYNKQEGFKKLLEKTKQFWKTDVCRDHVKMKLDIMSAIATKIERTFFWCAAVAILFTIVYSLGKGILPLGVWTLKEHKILFKSTQISEIIMAVFGAFGVVTVDCVFFVTCIQVIIQFKILGHCLSELNLSAATSERDGKQYNDKLKSYIQQHNFLLGFVEDLINYYSFAFMLECITVTPLICTEMYAIWDGNQLVQQIRHTTILVSVVFQLTVYCVVADSVRSECVVLVRSAIHFLVPILQGLRNASLLHFELLSIVVTLMRMGLAVGDAMYNSDWYSNFSPTLATRMIMLIQKAQQPIIFTAGGLFEIKNTTVLTVCTFMLSVLQSELKVCRRQFPDVNIHIPRVDAEYRS